MQDFTEEEAKGKLEELGFEVIAVEDLEHLGYSIERDGDKGWNACELSRTKGTFDRTAMSLSPRMPTAKDASLWLLGYLMLRGEHRA